MDALVILVTDPARPQDASVGLAADRLGALLPAGARMLRVPALDVDLADEVATITSVVVVAVDARATSVGSRRVEAAPHGEFGRALEPGHLLDIAYGNYGVCPRMLLLAVPPDASVDEITEEVLRLLGA